MNKLTDLKSSRFTLLQTAQSGHGKTTRTMSATRFGKVYIFDFDKKVQAMLRMSPEQEAMLKLPPNWKDLVDIDQFSNIAETQAKLNSLLALGDKIPYATVVIDTFSSLNEMVYAEVMGPRLEKGIKAEREEWQKIGDILFSLFNKFNKLSANLIVNAHIDAEEDVVTGKKIYGPDGRGKFRKYFHSEYTDKHYLLFEMGKYKVRLKNSDTLPVNTNVAGNFIDAQGFATVFDLSLFDDCAVKKL